MHKRLCLWSLLCILTLGAECFVDECSSLDSRGLRRGTHNLTLDFSTLPPITDRFRFFRNQSHDGFAQYYSEKGFEALTVIGYAYLSPTINNSTRGSWKIELRTGEQVGGKMRTVGIVNANNIHTVQEAFKGNAAKVRTNWIKFRIELGRLPLCPKVIEIWLRGRAAVASAPAKGLQIGRVILQESVFESCKIPTCLNNNEDQRCFNALKDSKKPIRTIHDSTRDFANVYVATDNIEIDTRNAVARFSGDGHRFRRSSPERGIITYSIPEGIASIEITLFRCELYRTRFEVVPYIDTLCKPFRMKPELKDDRYFSNCWKRYKTRIDFVDFLDCPPTYVDLVIDGNRANTLQISTVTLRGYGVTLQDADFAKEKAPTQTFSDSVPIEPVVVITANGAEPTDEDGGQSSVKLEHWLPATIIGGLAVLVIITGIILSRNGAVSDAVVDYIEDNFPFLYRCIYPPDPPAPVNTPRAQPGRVQYNTRSFAPESMNFSCTFDKSLKNSREPSAYRDVATTREGLGEQLIDLSKHLQKALWTSKVGKKQRVLEIEEPIGRGGYGKVWRARWQGTLVALKVVPFHANLNREEKQARMAIMEAALSGCLAHPNIVSTYACEIRESNDSDMKKEAFSVEDSQNNKDWMPIARFTSTHASKNFMKNQTKNDLEVRMIMEFCDRGSLVAAIQDGRFRQQDDRSLPDLEAILLTALDIARGLFCLHENDIIHGDLKPHNVLLQNRPFVDSRGFIAKIADFGLSIKMESEQSHVDGMRMGTCGYVSPEVAVRGKILPASDIYSFGILLWELYSGELIHDAIKAAPKLSSRLTMGSWRPLFDERCPQEYSRLACMCWNDFPDWRPSLDYIIDELNNMLKAQVPEEEDTGKAPMEPQRDQSDSNNNASTMTLP